MEKNVFTISVYTENNIGLLNRISAIFLKRHINLESFSTSESEIPNVFRFVIVVKTDASAAKGIALRRGMGRIRHIEVNQLWVQDKVAKKEIKIVKIATTENLADHLTKYLNQEGIQQHMNWTNQWLDEGRHSLMPEVAK